MRNILVHLALVFSLSSFALGGGGYGGGSGNCNQYGGPVKHCQYPPHSTPYCTEDNPCGFQCIDGFSPSPAKYPQTCVCPKPYTVCNGHCGPSKSCPSSVYYKRSVTGNKHLQCAQGMTACPIIGRANSWECVDTEKDLESCGGCVVSSSLTHQADGVDCTAIQGVSDASCFRGQCIVHQCLPGYEPNALEDSCIEAPVNVLFTAHESF